MKSDKHKTDLSLFQQIGDQQEEAWFVFDLKACQFLYLSQGFETIWKKKVEEVLTEPKLLLDTIHPEDIEYVKDNLGKFLEEREKMDLSFRIVWPYTDNRWIKLKVFPVDDENKASMVVGIAQDDSTRTKNIFNMQKINARKNSIMEILSHDLRGPIGIVQSLASAIEEDMPKGKDEQSQEQIRMLQTIQKVCKRNIDLIRDLIHQEFLESTQVEISKERLDLVWEINESIATYRNEQENIAKVFELTSSQERVFAQIDSMKFMQVINNLVSNAIKFTPDNGHIRIHIEKNADTIVISVSDNGIGIPKEYHSCLFEKFTPARRKGLKGEESVGLGMSIIKTIVEMHDGKIWFESEENQGTTFYIELSTDE